MESPEPQTVRALVTGAGRGIGAAIARALASAGHPVVVNYRENEAAASQVCAEINENGGEATSVRFNVAEAAEVDDALATLREDPRPIGIVINNAGVIKDGLFPTTRPDAWHQVTRTAIDGFYNVTRPLVMPMVKERWGRIVNIVSISGLVGNAGQVNYSAAKAGVIGATRSLAAELASRSITVNAVAPGIIDTDMTANLPAGALDRIPMRRTGRPEEVAALVGFLCSEQASYITGEVIGINGGLA